MGQHQAVPGPRDAHDPLPSQIAEAEQAMTPDLARRFADIAVPANEGSAEASCGARPRVAIDWQAYADALQDSDLSDAEKRAFVELMWQLVVSFVDLGFDMNPVQHVLDQRAARQED